jgi:hypothetical protein
MPPITKQSDGRWITTFSVPVLVPKDAVPKLTTKLESTVPTIRAGTSAELDLWAKWILEGDLL